MERERRDQEHSGQCCLEGVEGTGVEGLHRADGTRLGTVGRAGSGRFRQESASGFDQGHVGGECTGLCGHVSKIYSPKEYKH